MTKKMQKAYLYDEYDFVDELGEMELSDGQNNIHDIESTTSIKNNSDTKMIFRSKESVMSLTKETDEGNRYFFVIDNNSPRNTEVTYKENNNKETSELEIMIRPDSFNGPAEYETWEPSNRDDLLKYFEEDISKIKNNDQNKALGECLIIDSKDKKVMDKILSRMEKDQRDDTVNYSKEGYSSITVQEFDKKIAIFEEKTEETSLLKEFERKFNNELRKDIDSPSI